MTFDSEVIQFGIGSPNENRQLFIVKPKLHRSPYMDQFLCRVGKACYEKKTHIRVLTVIKYRWESKRIRISSNAKDSKISCDQ